MTRNQMIRMNNNPLLYFVQLTFFYARFFFHYSGHGGRVADTDNDEDDGYDETIYPLDFDKFDGTSGQILDDVRFLLLISF